jgi:O-antigen/teichoic acid export membrane protein
MNVFQQPNYITRKEKREEKGGVNAAFNNKDHRYNDICSRTYTLQSICSGNSPLFLKRGTSVANQPYKTSKDLLKGALVLSIAALIVKLLSAAYRIPYQNIVGDIGFYIYQQAYPFYAIVLTLSTLGFPIIISKLIAEREFLIKDILAASNLVLSVIALVMFTSLFLGAAWIADKMGDPHLTGLLKMISFYYLLMPFTTILRGYFQGINDMMPTAISQVTEQFIRVATILVLTPFLIYQGYSLYDAGEGAVFGSVIGGIVGLIPLLAFFIWRKEYRGIGQNRIHSRTFPMIIKVLLFQGLAFCISSLILVLFQLVDSLHLYSLLRYSGVAEVAAKEWKGIYDRGQPLLQLGTIVANSLSLSIVPIISGYAKKSLESEVLSKIRLALRVSITIGLAATVGLICMIKPVNTMLFTDTMGSTTLAIFSIAILFSSVIMTITAIIQSLGSYVVPVMIVLAGVIGKWCLNVSLIPRYGISGAAMATVFALFGMTICLSFVLKRYLKAALFSKKDMWMIICGTALMAIVLFLFNWIFELFSYQARSIATVQALLGVALGAVVFIFTILRGNLFKQEELVLLPFGYKLIRLNKKNRS